MPRQTKGMNAKRQGWSPCATAAWMLVLGSVVSFATPAYSLERVVLSADRDQIPLGEHLTYLEDREGLWSFEDVRASARTEYWQRTQASLPTFGFTASAYWFAVEIQNVDAVNADHVVEIAFSTTRFGRSLRAGATHKPPNSSTPETRNALTSVPSNIVTSFSALPRAP